MPKSKTVIIQEIMLIPHKGQQYSLLGDFEQLSITESIHHPFMSGVITINDTNMITEGYQLYSGAFLKIRFKTAENHPEFEKLFWIYKIGNDSQNSTTLQHKNRNIDLIFVSFEMYKEVREKYSKYYDDMYYHEIVEDVCKNFLDIPELNMVDNTRDKGSFPTNYGWSPLKIIEYCKVNSYSEENQDVGYLFFENADGFNYVSYSELLKQKPTRSEMELLFEPSKDFDRDTKVPTSSLLYIDKYSTGQNVDLIRSWHERTFGGSIHTLDLEDKKFQEITHKFDSDYLNSTWTLGSKSVTTQDYNNDQGFHIPYYGGFPDNQLPIFSRKGMTDNNVIVVQVSGDTKKKAGMIIYFEYMSKKPKEMNNYLKGHWLIETITHTITNRIKYSQSISISKDTFDQDGLNVFDIKAKVNT